MTIFRFGLLFSALALLLLASCGTAGEAPRLDFGHGVVVAFDKGTSSEVPGKVSYVTHVPSGSQMVISRHDSRDDGPAQLDVILADEVIMGDIIAGGMVEFRGNRSRLG